MADNDLAQGVGPYISAIRPNVALALEAAVLTGMTIPILIALLYFSTPRLRSTLMWRVVTVAVVFGILFGGWSVFIVSQPFRKFASGRLPPHMLRQYQAFTIITNLAPWLVDWPLFARLLVVYRDASPRCRLAIIGTAILLRMASGGTALTWAIQYAWMFIDDVEYDTSMVVGRKLPMSVVNLVLRLVDNTFTTALFLWKLRAWITMPEFEPYTSTNGACSKNSVSSRIRALFWIATSNFVFPLIFTVITIITTMTSPFMDAALILWANIYVTLFGVVLATVWSTSIDLKQEQVTKSTSYATKLDPNPRHQDISLETLQESDIRSAGPIAFSPRRPSFTLEEQARVLAMKVDLQLGFSDFEQGVGRNGLLGGLSEEKS